MQSQKLPLWQLFLFPCAKQRYLPPSRQPGHSAHIRSGIHGTRRSSPGTTPTPARTARHTDNPPGSPAQGARHKAHATHAAPGSRIRLVRQSRPHRCGRLPFFSAGASPRGTTLPGDPLILRRPHSFPENPDPSPESLLFGKPLGLEADIRAVGRHQVCPRRLGRYVADDIDAPHAHHLLL